MPHGFRFELILGLELARSLHYALEPSAQPSETKLLTNFFHLAK